MRIYRQSLGADFLFNPLTKADVHGLVVLVSKDTTTNLHLTKFIKKKSVTNYGNPESLLCGSRVSKGMTWSSKAYQILFGPIPLR